MKKEQALIAFMNWYQLQEEEIRDFSCIVISGKEDGAEIIELESFIGLDKDHMDYSKLWTDAKEKIAKLLKS